MKNSDPNHLQSLYKVHYPPYVIPRTIGGVTRKSLACPSHLFKLALYFHCIPMLENCSKLGDKMKNSDPNHPQALYRVYYPPYIVPRTIGRVTRKSYWRPSQHWNWATVIARMGV